MNIYDSQAMYGTPPPPVHMSPFAPMHGEAPHAHMPDNSQFLPPATPAEPMMQPGQDQPQQQPQSKPMGGGMSPFASTGAEGEGAGGTGMLGDIGTGIGDAAGEIGAGIGSAAEGIGGALSGAAAGIGDFFGSLGGADALGFLAFL